MSPAQKSALSPLLVAALISFAIAPANAANVIQTPSASALLPQSFQVRYDQKAGDTAQSNIYAAYGWTYAEFEVAGFRRLGQDAAALSLETQLVPETASYPSLAFGVRDITSATHTYHGDGYHGRAAYLVAGRSPIDMMSAPLPLRNLSYSFGLGLNGIRGPFGAVSGDLPLKLRWSVEWDSRKFNEQLALPLTNSAQVQLTRLGKDTLLGVEFHTPLTVF
jgi:hypothetical protein